MKYKIVPLSKVQEGNGCMLPERFLDECDKCSRVMRCKNEQAFSGRTQSLESQRRKMLSKIYEVDRQLKASKWDEFKMRLKYILIRLRGKR